MFALGVFLIVCGFLVVWSDQKQYRLWGKRTLDLVLGAILFFLFLPVMIIVSVVVLFDAGWPIIFRQIRLGRNLKEFSVFKFHTLKGLNGQPYEKFRTYEECERNATRIGKFLRHHCLDELPQFVNVLMGNVSLVGNRPTLPDYYERFNIGPETVKALLRTKPGLTGYVQIFCFKNNCDNPDYVVKHGLAYAKDYSLWVDLKLLLKTVFVIFRGR